ncbi:MAG: hypothetical protein GC186_02790 [Rhodobacteraceae bacterium]|nr:hypothetical protein [Paracoccaceae bacterium]
MLAEAAVAPCIGLLAGTQILTLAGEMPVEFLNPRDRIITRSGARTLRGITVTPLHNARAVRVSAGSLGHDRPGRDLVIGADQPVLVRDWRAPALFGAAQALVAVGRLVDGQYVRHVMLATAQMITLEFDRPETVYADGVELGCPAFAGV